jgi:uncharacterized protein
MAAHAACDGRAMRAWRWVLRIAVAYAVLCVIAGVVLAEFSLRLPKKPLGDTTAFRMRMKRDFHAEVQDVSLTAGDGAVMKAWFVRPPNANGEAVVLLHGIADNRVSIAGFSEMFLRRGYSVLMPDSRDQGESGGKIATYGTLERDDVRRWVAWVRQSAPGCTYLLGESMGAAIGLEATAVTPQLCAVAVESPYADSTTVSYERLGWMTRLGTTFWRTVGRPVIPIAKQYSRVVYRYYSPEVQPILAVQSSKVPTLLIAGTADHAILMHHSQELAAACPSHCELWIVPGADHGGATTVAHEEFERRVLAWFAGHGEGTH